VTEAHQARGDSTRSAEPLWRHPAFRVTLSFAAIAALTAPLWWTRLESLLFQIEFALVGMLPGARIASVSIWLLPIVGLVSGVLASVSPCILPLVPLNVAYIGASEATGWRAVSLSGRFVLGAALTLSVLGLFGELAGFVLVEQRGPMLLIVGIALVYFGLVVLEVAPHLFRGSGVTGGSRLGPVGAGAAFSLVTTPCASPLLAAVLAASAAQSVPGLSVATMACFSLGYTLLVFLAGVFGGKLVGFSRRIPLAAPRAAAAALLVVSGLAFAATGATWF
jgi:cytochrome c-type biogenesis protein